MAIPKTTISYPIELCLRIAGVWPKSSHKILQRAFIFNFIGILLTFQLWYCISYAKSLDLPELLDGLSLTISNAVLFLKLLIIWYYYRTFRNVLETIFDDWNNSTLTSQYKQLMMDQVNLSTRFSRSLVSLYITCCTFYLVAPIFLPEDTGQELSSNNRKLILKMRLPFNVMVSPIYEIFLIIQVVFQNLSAFLALMFMALFAALALHVGGQINIICQRLVEFRSDDTNEARKELKYIVTKHQQILQLSDNIKSVFTYISFVQFFANSVVICFLGFVVVTSLGAEDASKIITKCLPYFIAVNIEAFILCYTGEYLTSKSENINHAAYNMIWYKLRPRENRYLLLLLIGSKRPITLTAGKIANLSVETFANMVKASVSYISVLLAMY